jgi:transposase-like protein
MIDWGEAAIIVIPLPKCPSCDSREYVPVRGWRDADGGKTSRRVCKACSTPYVVLTLPDFGDCENRIVTFPAKEG